MSHQSSQPEQQNGYIRTAEHISRSGIYCISALCLQKTWLTSAIPDGVVDPQDCMLIQGDGGT